jgi:amino acid permease
MSPDHLTSGASHDHLMLMTMDPDAAGADDGVGSTVAGAVFNFTNSIVGAGAVGLGGAIAQSGGAIAILTILLFAVLTKLSLDMVVKLSLVHCEPSRQSYEELGNVSFGVGGKVAVMVSKFIYAVGCLVAYVVVVRDNFGPAAHRLLCEQHYYVINRNENTVDDLSAFPLRPMCEWILTQDMLLTWFLSATVILPLCLLRNMSHLSGLSLVSFTSMLGIVGIVLYLYFMNPAAQIQHSSTQYYQDWFVVRPAYVRWYVALIVEQDKPAR